MKYENFQITTMELHKGVQKLVKYGMDTFEMYADEIGMGYCDRNRVIAKCKRAWGMTDLLEIPCPKSIIGERWEYYTKVMRYKPDHARRLLKLIDASYENQFVPDLDKALDLAKDVGDEIPF